MAAPHLDVVSIDTPNLGDRSYVVAREGQAIVIDPQRDLDRVTSVLDSRGWQLTHVLETHFHNDYVSGGLELARDAGATYVVPDGMPTDFAAQTVGDGSFVETGAGTIRVLHTPGHTPNHVSFIVGDQAVFTGGSMLYGSVGRPDLLGPALTEPLARAQWASMRRIADSVAHEAQVYPTHGFGSFCSATATSGTSSTIAEQLLRNPAFHADEDDFVRELIAGLDAYPAYYAHMGPANQAGAGPIDLSLPSPANAADIAARIAAGEWVVDLRQRRLYAGEHVRGTYSFDVRGNAVTYLGWLIPWGTPITLLGADPEEVATMQRELVRIGIDRPVGYAIGTPSDWAADSSALASFPRKEHTDLAAALAKDPGLPMLDLRRRSEVEQGFVRGAKHVALHELPARLDEVLLWAAAARPDHGAAWLYCGSGFRASIAASILDGAGAPVILVDDDWMNAATAGLPIAHPDALGDRLGSAYAD